MGKCVQMKKGNDQRWRTAQPDSAGKHRGVYFLVISSFGSIGTEINEKFVQFLELTSNVAVAQVSPSDGTIGFSPRELACWGRYSTVMPNDWTSKQSSRTSWRCFKERLLL